MKLTGNRVVVSKIVSAQQRSGIRGALPPAIASFYSRAITSNQFVRVSTRSGLPKSAFLMARMRLIFLRLRISQGFS